MTLSNLMYIFRQIYEGFVEKGDSLSTNSISGQTEFHGNVIL